MLSGCLQGFLSMSGLLILRIVYGKGLEEKLPERRALMEFLSIVNTIWFIGVLIFIGEFTTDGSVAGLAVMLIYPAVIAVWAIIARQNLKKADAIAIKQAMKEQMEQQKQKNGYYAEISRKQRRNAFCPACGALRMDQSEICSKCGAKISKDD